MEWLEKDSSQTKLLSGILIFNVLDIIFTLFFVGMGFAVEANPFMLAILEHGEVYFAITKLVIVSSCVYILWSLRKEKLAQIASFLCFLVYSALMLYHMYGAYLCTFL